MLLAPLEELLHVLELPVDEGPLRVGHPVAEGHPHRVQPVLCHPADVVLRDPGAPVLLHARPLRGLVEMVHEAVLVLCSTRIVEVVSGTVFEQVPHHPLLQQEPAPKIDSTDQGVHVLVASRELHFEELPTAGIVADRLHVAAPLCAFGLQELAGRGVLESALLVAPPLLAINAVVDKLHGGLGAASHRLRRRVHLQVAVVALAAQRDLWRSHAGAADDQDGCLGLMLGLDEHGASTSLGVDAEHLPTI
mmetsp:Transcript_140647/g.341701  ORF Transcript_140647/g.341701 Transcript_140647/m.341701 type:complete len:249 (-) Transcript_140647:676-1422(-)